MFVENNISKAKFSRVNTNLINQLMIDMNCRGEEFALRLGASPHTINAWLDGEEIHFTEFDRIRCFTSCDFYVMLPATYVYYYESSERFQRWMDLMSIIQETHKAHLPIELESEQYLTDLIQALEKIHITPPVDAPNDPNHPFNLILAYFFKTAKIYETWLFPKYHICEEFHDEHVRKLFHAVKFLVIGNIPAELLKDFPLASRHRNIEYAAYIVPQIIEDYYDDLAEQKLPIMYDMYQMLRPLKEIAEENERVGALKHVNMGVMSRFNLSERLILSKLESIERSHNALTLMPSVISTLYSVKDELKRIQIISSEQSNEAIMPNESILESVESLINTITQKNQ